jgi:hypothetical protein
MRRTQRLGLTSILILLRLPPLSQPPRHRVGHLRRPSAEKTSRSPRYTPAPGRAARDSRATSRARVEEPRRGASAPSSRGLFGKNSDLIIHDPICYRSHGPAPTLLRNALLRGALTGRRRSNPPQQPHSTLPNRGQGGGEKPGTICTPPYSCQHSNFPSGGAEQCTRETTRADWIEHTATRSP